jgi:hypothetical protein
MMQPRWEDRQILRSEINILRAAGRSAQAMLRNARADVRSMPTLRSLPVLIPAPWWYPAHADLLCRVSPSPQCIRFLRHFCRAAITLPVSESERCSWRSYQRPLPLPRVPYPMNQPLVNERHNEIVGKVGNFLNTCVRLATQSTSSLEHGLKRPDLARTQRLDIPLSWTAYCGLLPKQQTALFASTGKWSFNHRRASQYAPGLVVTPFTLESSRRIGRADGVIIPCMSFFGLIILNWSQRRSMSILRMRYSLLRSKKAFIIGWFMKPISRL